MFGLSIALLVFVLDTSLKAALVAVAAAALMKLLRLGDSNLRHRIWTGVLAGMLLLPLLTPIVPALRLPLLPSSESLLAWLQSPIEAAPVTDKESRLGVAPPSDTENTPASIATFDKSPAVAPFNALLAENSVFARAEAVPPPAETEKTPELADSHAAEQTSAEPASNLSSPRRPTSRRFIAAAIFCLAAIWFIGSLVLAVRLIAGLWLAAGLRRSSTAIDATELSGRVAWPLACSSARQSKQVIVPITVGFLHPQIILPQTWRTWPADKLQAVLAHESMHIERGDCAIALLAEVNCCLYWFHPLAWWLKRQLAELAEQACDDAAIAALGDRAQYARHLLEVAAAASRYRGRLAPAGLSMAHASGVEIGPLGSSVGDIHFDQFLLRLAPGVGRSKPGELLARCLHCGPQCHKISHRSSPSRS